MALKNTDAVGTQRRKKSSKNSFGGYYTASRSGYIPWEQFATIDISKCFAGVRVADEAFTANGKKLLQILKNIQKNLAQHERFRRIHT